MVEMVSSLQETVQSKASVAVETIFKRTAVICTKALGNGNNDLGNNNTYLRFSGVALRLLSSVLTS